MTDINYMQPDFYIYLFIALIGLAIGSFLNVLIHRLPRQIPIVFRRSACPNCRMPIPIYHNIPLLSYILLLGRCNICRHPISPRYPIVELFNGGLYILFYYLDGWSLALPVHCFLASALIAIFFIDFEFHIIPDAITIPGMIIGLITSLFMTPPGILDSVIGLLVGGLSLLGIAYLGELLFKKEAMGGGDIKMAAMMGAFVGWQKVMLIFFGGAIIGLIGSIVWMSLSKQVRRDRIIPFGPFLALAALVVVIYGEQIIKYYIENYLIT